MKREILFKAVRVDNEEWAFGNLVKYMGHQQEFTDAIQVLDEENKVKCVINIYPDTVCQFTGLLDKNGEKIFEGDIISDIVEAEDGDIISKQNVFWDEKSADFRLDCSFEQNRKISCPLYRELRDYEYEVIGNIHDKKQTP